MNSTRGILQLSEFEEMWNSPEPRIPEYIQETLFNALPGALMLLWITYFHTINDGIVKNIIKSIKLTGKGGSAEFKNSSQVIMFLFSAINLIHAAEKLSNLDRTNYYIHFISMLIYFIKSILLIWILFLFRAKEFQRIPGLLWTASLFELLFALSGTYQVVTVSSESRREELVVYAVQLTASLLLFLSFCCNQVECQSICNKSGLRSRDQSPFVSRLFLWWFTLLVKYGYKKPLDFDDLPALNNEMNAKYMSKKFHEIASKPHFKRIKLLPLMARVFWKDLITIIVLQTLSDCLALMIPVLIKFFIAFVKSDFAEPNWHGYFFGICMFACSFASSLLTAQVGQLSWSTKIRMQLSINSSLYDKVLRMRRADLKDFNVGKISNLMSVDSSTFVAVMDFISMLWSAPLRLLLGAYLMYQTAGSITFISLGSWSGVMLIMTLLTQIARKYVLAKLEVSDRRVKLTNEVLNGIKSIKFYAWEECLIEEIGNIRQEEIGILKKFEIFDTIFNLRTPLGSWIGMASLFSCRLIMEGKSFSSEEMFFILSIVEILTLPMAMMVRFFRYYMMTSVSAKRLEDFLNIHEGKSYVKRAEIPKAFEIRAGQFSWNNGRANESVVERKDEPDHLANQFKLKDINLTVETGTLTCVIGPVGSGKSSLLKAVLGEMVMEKGEVKVREGLTIAVVSQEAWIQNMTLKQNILFGKNFNEERYRLVLKACELLDDLSILPGGDETEIGENGINLSGGQKQRVSLARAVYQDADIYFLDDCLSALDAHVSRRIFNQILHRETGLLKEKTRFLATNRLDIINEVDQIILINDGSVIEIGKPDQLVELGGKVSELISNYADQISSENTDESGVHVKSKFPQVTPGNLIDKEFILEGHVHAKVFADLIRKCSKIWLTISLISLPLATGSSIYSRMILADWTGSPDSNSVKNNDYWYLILFTIISACEAIFQYLLMTGIAFAYISTCAGLHSNLLKGVLYSPIQFFETTPLGRILNRFSKDMNSIDLPLRESLRLLFHTFAFTAAGVIGSLIVEPRMGLIIGLMVIVSVYMLKFFVPPGRRLKGLESVAKSPIYSHFRETVVGLDLIRAFGVSSRFVEEFHDKSNRHGNSEYLMAMTYTWRTMIMGFLSSFIFLFIATFGVLGKEKISGEHIGILLSYAVRILGSMEFILKHLSDTGEHVIAVERVLEYTELPSEGERFKVPFDPSHRWPFTGEIELLSYSARYRSGLQPTLRDLTASIRPTEKIGVVGRTGAGKSSLTLSLFRMIDRVQGNILIDKTNTEDIGLFHLRSGLSIIPQDPIIFSGTVRFNLDPFKKFSDEEVWKALEMSHLRSYFENFGAGLEYVLEESGKNLSLGQKQLICLARSLLKKSKILVLDEATGSIDMETDSLVQTTLRKEFSESTMLIIAHRLNTIIDCDRVMVLDRGRIIEFDSPGNLLRDRNSKFHALAQDAGIIAND